MDDLKPGARPEPRPDLQPVTPSLKGAVRRARIEEAERTSVMAELRGAEIARLEILAEALEPVFAQVPEHVDIFDAGVMPGETPRLYIDMIGFVEMGPDRRSYRFVQNTRHGRVTAVTSEKVEVMVEALTTYIARRLVEREQALASDRTIEDAARAYSAVEPVEPRREQPRRKQRAAANAAVSAPIAAEEPPRRRGIRGAIVESVIFLAELIGFIVLLVILFGALYFGWTLAEGWWQAYFNKSV
jgi:hypothetical protein